MDKKRATLVFVIVNDNVLMINRNKPPFMGLWNALGGKVKDNESIFECAKREVKEESGLDVVDLELFSTFTWNYDSEIGYAFKAYVDSGIEFKFPLNTDEGIIDLKPIDWVIDPKNYGVIEDLRVFLTDIKNDVKQDYHLVYKGKKLKKAKKVNNK